MAFNTYACILVKSWVCTSVYKFFSVASYFYLVLSATKFFCRLLGNTNVLVQQSRTRVYQSWKSARPKSVLAVPARFKRLSNELWVRPVAGRHRSLWKRKPETLENLKEHVICNKRQCWLLERMVGKYWKRHRHYPNDPYAPYHVRNGFPNDKVYQKSPFYP